MIDRRTWRRLGLAAVLSGAAHAAVILLGHLDLPRPPEERLPLAVRIVSAPPPASMPSPRVPERKTRPSRSRRAVPVHEMPREMAAMPLPAAAPAPFQSLEEAAAAEPEPAGETAVAPTPAEPVIVATAPSTSYAPAPRPLRSLPRKGRITYSLVYGPDGFPVGRTVQSWQMDGSSYRLASHSETTGLVDLFRSQYRTYFSRGALTREGLRPETFLMSRNRGRGRGTDEARARFDWDGAIVTLGAADRQHTERLPPRSQDLLSFMYQLSLDPPSPGRLRQVVTNGSHIETYELDVRAEETIDTPLGALRALPIRQVGKPGEETIELWLATEYRYLPVRLRFFDREGQPQGEQTVTEIRLSEE